jgi:hypothetical protein
MCSYGRLLSFLIWPDFLLLDLSFENPSVYPLNPPSETITFVTESGFKNHLNRTPMHEITIKVPDQKIRFFMELIQNLGIEVIGGSEIPEFQKELVRDRIRNSKVENLVSWEEARKKLSTSDKV